MAAAGNRTTGFTWNTLAYVQRGSSASRFSAINPSRTGEVPILDRFAVPTTAWGASWTGAWRHLDASRTNAGADLRYARGETREDFAFTNGAFTRQLFAGGNQGFLGLFVSHDQAITPALRATIGTRVDAWSETDGYHREVDHLTHAMMLDQRHGADRGLEFSPSLGAVWQPNKHWRWRAHGQHSFRRPTLGERYQTSASNRVVTAANPELPTGHNTSIEVAAEYSLFRKADSAVLTLEAKAFLNELRDTAGYLTLARGSGEFPLLDTLPAGYLGRKRINLDRARVQGIELSATWHPDTALTLEASLLLNDATTLRSTLSPALDGKRMPDVPRRTALLSATWRPTEAISLRLRVRSIGRQFVDGENTLLLGEAVIADFGATCILNKHTELYLTVENLTDSNLETSRDADGLVYIGSPRLVLGGLRLKW
jgi:outer membrane receptor protein involved in Fe transport